MPTTNFKGVKKMSKQCSTSIPKWIEKKYTGLENNLSERKKVAKEIAIDFCQKLMINDFKAIHFYTLNQSELTLSVCQDLNISYE
jgi:5,10-methylenetetrahydrofolate reductase